MKKLFAFFILFYSCHISNKSSTHIFQPSDLTGLWQVDNKDNHGTMEFKNDSLLIMEYQGNNSFCSYHIHKSDTQYVLEIHPKESDSLKIAFMKIEKINQNKITIEFIKVSVLNESNNTYKEDTSHSGSVITLIRKK